MATSDDATSEPEIRCRTITISASQLIRDFIPCGACNSYVLRETGCSHIRAIKRDRNRGTLSRYNDKWVWPEGMTAEDKKRIRAREYARRKRASLTSGQ